MESIKKRANESAHKYYDCKSCEWRCECKMDKGSNTPFECCDCAADDYMIGYAEGATEQREIDIEKFVKYAEDFNKQNEEMGISTRVDVDSMRMWARNILCRDEFTEKLKRIAIKWESSESLIRDFNEKNKKKKDEIPTE